MMELQLRRRDERGVTLVEVGGEIDLNSAPRLRQELLSDGDSPLRVVVDLSRVTFIDSSGIGVLAGAFKRAREAGGQMGLLRPHPRVRRVLEITGLAGVLPVWDSLDEALSALGGASEVEGAAIERPGLESSGLMGTLEGGAA